MLSEELLLDLKGIDAETTIEELVKLVKEHRHQRQRDLPEPLDEWSYLADAAFLASYHNRPRAFKTLIDIIAYMFGILYKANPSLMMDGAARSCVLICSDAPTDPLLTAFICGHLKGDLKMAWSAYNHLSGDDRADAEKAINWLLKQVIPELRSDPLQTASPA